MSPSFLFNIIHWPSAIVLFASYIYLLKKKMDISLGLLIVLLIGACLPFFNIFVFAVCGGFDRLQKYFETVIIKKEDDDV